MPSRGHETIDHTADMGIRGWGRTPRGSLRGGGRRHVRAHGGTRRARSVEAFDDIACEGADLTELLIEFLNGCSRDADFRESLIGTSRSTRSKKTSDGSWTLEAAIGGVPVAERATGCLIEVKAATYYGASVREQDDGRVRCRPARGRNSEEPSDGACRSQKGPRLPLGDPEVGRDERPGRIYADEDSIRFLLSEGKSKEWDALLQVRNVACLPGIRKASLAMADIHPGYGFPIGGVGAFDLDTGVVTIAGVGFDINCGVRTMIVNIAKEEVDVSVAPERVPRPERE